MVYEINKLKIEEDQEEVKNKVVALETHKIQTVVLDDKSQIEKIKNHYLLKSDDLNDLLNQEAVESWLSSALSLEGRKLSVDEEEVDWKKFQFTGSDQKIELFTEQKAIKISLSPMRSFDGGVYLRVTENKKDYLFSSSEKWVKFFNRSAGSLRETRLFDWTAIDKEFTPLKLEIKTEKDSYSLTKNESLWSPASEKIKGWMIDSSKVESFLSDMKTFMIEDFSSINPKKSDLKYSLTLTTDSDRSPFILKVYEVDKTHIATVNFRPEVAFKISSENHTSLFPEAQEFKDFKSDLTVDEPLLKKLNVKKNNTQLEFYKDKESHSWTVNVKAVNKQMSGESSSKEQEFNSSSVLEVVDTLKSLKPERYLSENPKDMGKEEAKFTFFDENDQIVKDLRLFQKKTPCVKGQSKPIECKLLQIDKSFLVVKEEEINKLTSIDYFKSKNKKTTVE